MTGEFERTSSEWRQSLQQQTRALQTVVGALIFGVLAFTFSIVPFWAAPPQGRILSLATVGLGALTAVLHVVVPIFIERAALAHRAVGSGLRGLMSAYFARTIVASALLEGAAFFSIVAFMIEHHHWVLGVTGMMVLLMLMQFPTRTRAEQWLETRLMELDVEPR